MQTSTSCVCLSRPWSPLGEWESSWFDPAHQHMLLLRYSEVFIWSLKVDNDLAESNDSNKNENSVNGTKLIQEYISNPVKLYHLVGLGDQVILLKLSLDGNLLAVQSNPIRVNVFDVKSKRKWEVTIRSLEENKILPGGIVWSDHGGNSQDLIIVTMKGLELHKISEVRGQCKLSRTISQNCTSFWYEPNHRVMLLGSQGKFGETVLLHGIFFRTDKSDIPRLELPPPDKSPGFELSASVNKYNISLVTIYGQLLCVSLHNMESSDYLCIHNISKNQVIRSHVLMLNLLTKFIRVSVVDNLLLCHCLDADKTVIFDILSAPTRSVVWEDGNSVDVMIPIVPGAPLTYESQIESNEVSTNERKATTNDSHLHVETHTSTPLRRGSRRIDDEGDDWNAVDKTKKDIVPSLITKRRISRIMESPIAQADALVASDGILKSKRIADEVYSSHKWRYLSPHWVLDVNQTRLWQLTIDLQGIEDTVADYRRSVPFLCRRGQPFLAPKPVYQVLEAGIDANEVKTILLAMLACSIRKSKPIATMETFFKLLLSPYALEHNRLQFIGSQRSFETITTASAATTMTSSNLNNINSTATSLNRAKSQRKASFGFSFSQRTLSVSIPSDSAPSESSTTPAPNLLIDEPLEPSFCSNTYLPSISNISAPIRYQGTANDVINNSMAQFSVPYIVSTRRDEEGLLILTQTEILDQVWMPLATKAGADFNYILLALNCYIASLRCVSVTIHPALLLLSIHLHIALRKYLEVSRLLQFQFYPDGTEVAMAALELADIMMDTELCNNSSREHCRLMSAVRTLQRTGIDMLWKLREQASVVRWLLGHMKVGSAMKVCSRRPGNQHRAGLTPTTIPGVEFFVAASMLIDCIHKRFTGDTKDLKIAHAELVAIQELIVAETETLDREISYPQTLIDETKLDSDPTSNTSHNSFHAIRNGLFWSVYMFIRDWEPALLVTMHSGKSKLASQCTFPEHVFDDNTSQGFKKLFGFV